MTNAPRLRAPELTGRRWINTGGRDLSLADLRGKLIRLATSGHAGNLLVADSGHHSLVEYDPSGSTILARYGSGERGRTDGPAETAKLSEPGGLAELPAELAAEVGYHVVIADTVNHLLRGLNLDTRGMRFRSKTGLSVQFTKNRGARGTTFRWKNKKVLGIRSHRFRSKNGKRSRSPVHLHCRTERAGYNRHRPWQGGFR